MILKNAVESITSGCRTDYSKKFSRMINRIVIAALFSFFALVGFANQVQVQVESQPIVVGKPFTVTFRISDPSRNFTPDFSELEKKFNLLSTATSTRITIINGQRQAEIIWSVVLKTEKAGKITIPAVNFGPLSSQEIPITVEKRGGNVNNPIKPDQQPFPVFLQVEVNNKKPYINEAVIYTVKLYRQRGVFINGNYQQQEVDNALMVPLNKSQNNTILSDGRAFLVESMTYAIYPNDQGRLTIKPPALRGTVSDIYMRRFDIDANEINLDVQPIPKSAQNYWLPAMQVSFSQEFSQDTNHLKQGDTVVRTIKLSANGLPAQLIPEIKLPAGSQAKRYEEKPERDNIASNNQIIGTLRLKVTYLLEKSGIIDLPEIKVRWFNIKARKFETAKLAKQQWQVSASQYGNTGQINTPTVETKPLKRSVERSKKSVHKAIPDWNIMIPGVLLAGGILALLFALFRRKKIRFSEVSINERRMRQQLRAACRKSNANKARLALIDLAALYFGDSSIINLSQISSQVGHSSLAKAIQELNQSLYSPKPGTHWQGEALWRAWEDYYNNKKKTSKIKRGQFLSPMFPEI